VSTLVIDGNNILKRSFFATQGRTTLSGDGINTAPVFVFINMVSKYVKQVAPEHLVVCWDGGRSTYRTEVYPDYKSERPVEERTEEEQAEDRTHFALASEFLTLAGLHHVKFPGVEADDLVAYYASTAPGDVMILSGDKDFLQLLNATTTQLRPGVEPEHWTEHTVIDKLGTKPEHIPFLMALTGDKIDGIPGVPGFGNITAAKALAAHDWSLQRLADTSDPKWRKKLGDEPWPILRRNLALVDLRIAAANIDYQPPRAPVFTPTSPESALWGALMDWCNRYDMQSVKARLVAHELWAESQGSLAL
jgi:DNA polymerase-1